MIKSPREDGNISTVHLTDCYEDQNKDMKKKTALVEIPKGPLFCFR